MDTAYNFAFGQPVNLIQQHDRTPKRAFVLGVYASAVHARWIGPANRTRISALAVASEPYIFWRGENADTIIDAIPIPDELGRLVPAASNLNGPSGRALDDLFLKPLKLTRDDAWLCDLVPHSCMNPGQKKAIEREYVPIQEKYGLPTVNLPSVPKQLSDEKRRGEILAEIEAANPNVIILLGDQPIRWFLNFFDERWNTLADFGNSPEYYGRLHNVSINNIEYACLPLVHPRQAAKLGAHSAAWSNLHTNWIAEFAHELAL